MQLDPVLLDLLRCPCPQHAELSVGRESDPAADALTCTRCKSVFPVRDDIPVMLLDEAEVGPQGIGAEVSA